MKLLNAYQNLINILLTSMKNIFIVDILQGQAHLDEPHDNILHENVNLEKFHLDNHVLF